MMDDLESRLSLALKKTLLQWLIPTVEHSIKAEYEKLKGPPYHIHLQARSGHLSKWPETAATYLKYANINNNDFHKFSCGSYDYTKFNYEVRSDVDFAKLFLQPKMVHKYMFSNFDDCALPVVLKLLCSVPAFSQETQEAAAAVRDVRNEWSCNRNKAWGGVKIANSFKKMKQLIKSFKFSAAKEGQILGKLSECESKGNK